jgi:diacylglycerol kinase family enzyme
VNCFFIINPHARNGRAKKTAPRLLSLLEQTSLSCAWSLTDSMEHAFHLSRNAQKENYDAIVAVGGDGTINRVLNGFFDAGGHRISRAKMGAIHIGTSPDFCKSYGIPRSLENAVHALSAGTTSLVRVGMMTCVSSSDPDASACPGRPLYFGCCANIGLGASLARSANSGIRKYAGDTAGTFISLLGVLFRYRPATVSLSMDGRQRTLANVYDIAVGRTRHIASGIQVLHQLGPLDDRLYVVTVKNLTPASTIGVLRLLYGENAIPAGKKEIALDYCHRIHCSGDTRIEVECDGDPAGFCPCTITTAPDTLELIVGNSDAR